MGGTSGLVAPFGDWRAQFRVVDGSAANGSAAPQKGSILDAAPLAQQVSRLFRRHHAQFFRYRKDRQTLNRPGGFAIYTDQRLAHQRDPIELTVKVGLKNVRRGQMRGRAIVPKGDVALVPLETHRVFRARDMLP